MLEAIVIEPKKKAENCVIWMHGLGADGHDFEGIIPELRLPETHNIRFVFPHAPIRPVTINMHMQMRAWYDIYTLDNLDLEDESGIKKSCELIDELVQQQAINKQRIVLAGFSQGGAIALYMGLNSVDSYAGIIALSAYLPFLHSSEKRPTTQNASLPILQCHGNYDDIIPARLGKETNNYLKKQSNTVQWNEYAMGHQVCTDEIIAIGDWLKEQLL